MRAHCSARRALVCTPTRSQTACATRANRSPCCTLGCMLAAAPHPTPRVARSCPPNQSSGAPPSPPAKLLLPRGSEPYVCMPLPPPDGRACSRRGGSLLPFHPTHQYKSDGRRRTAGRPSATPRGEVERRAPRPHTRRSSTPSTSIHLHPPPPTIRHALIPSGHPSPPSPSTPLTLGASPRAPCAADRPARCLAAPPCRRPCRRPASRAASAARSRPRR